MIGRQQAADALAIVEESRGAIDAMSAQRSYRRFLAPALRAFTPIVVHATRDFLPDRRVRWLVVAGWYAAATGSAFLVSRNLRLMPLPGGFKSAGAANRRLLLGGLLTVGSLVLERLIVVRLRASRLRRPNLVAGLVMAGITAGQQLLYRKLQSDPPAIADDSVVAHVHPSLEEPATLRLCALLNAAGLNLEYARANLLQDMPDLDERLQALVAEGLVFSPDVFGSRWAFLTPGGQQAFAQHVQALQRASLSTGDTPH